ncbi:TPA: hypothetical protein MDT29_000887 [Klebsiella pneumoniae]|nr:hypothetical protein [Klebsiella pneumoniae]HBV3020948.1 hypothetical protein [Klebsiella pneumoniae]HBV3057528.1 hypothetical protein [Klebsiella pneumoniae]
MTKSTITRERLEWLSQISCRDDIEDIGGDEIRELASMALAAMDSEPLAVTDDELNTALQLHRLTVDGHSQLSDAFRAGFRYARRTSPQPAPVVPEKKSIPNTLSMYAVDAVAAIAEVKGWNACRAAMLQTSPVCTCPSGDGSLRWPCPMHAGNSPAIGIDLVSGQDRTVEVRYVAPPGYVMVPKESTAQMYDAGDRQMTTKQVWDAMLAAAPQEVK